MNTKPKFQIRGLTVWQPWDHAITFWNKDIENRGYAPPRHLVSHYLGIHRGKTYDMHGARWLAHYRDELCIPPGAPIPAKKTESGIVAVARLCGVVHPDNDDCPSPWRAGGDQFGWMLAEVVPIELVPCAGKQGLWMLQGDILQAVRDNYLAAKRKQLALPETTTMHTLYTLGYTGWKPEAITEIIEELDAVLLDIRYNPTSRAPQWRQPAFMERLNSPLLPPRYEWVHSLGNINYKSDGPIELADPSAALHIVEAHLKERPVILMCACKDHRQCHRTVAAQYIAGELGAKVEHLYPK